MKKRNIQLISRTVSAMLILALVLACIPVYANAENNSDDPFIMVSLGDSYSSGEGIPDFYGQEKSLADKVLDRDWLAHRSTLSWPGQLMVSGITADGKTMKDYKVAADETSSAACQWYFAAVSGAETKHIKNDSQPKYYYQKATLFSDPLEDTIDLPPQLNIFNRISGASVDYVTMSLGGNDVDFAGVVTTTVLDSKYIGHAGTAVKLALLWSKIETYKANIKQAYKDVADCAPNAAIIVAGYPKLFSNWGSGAISIIEAAEVNDSVVKFNDVLNGLVTECSNEGINIHFVNVMDAFDGHGAGAVDEWINPIMPRQSEDLNGKVTNLFSAYSVHPNKEGAEAYAECVNKKIEEIEMNKRKGDLEGDIRKASDRTTPVTEARIRAFASTGTYDAVPDGNGHYKMTMPINRYYVTVNADGYVPFKAYAVIKENQTEYMQTFLMVEGEETDTGSAQGMITNSLNGAGLSDVTLDVRKGWNNEDDGEILTTVTTDDYGAYLVTLPIGNYTLCASKEGFAPTMVNIIVQKTNSGNQNGTMTPILSGDDYRIVLTWGENPRDLDSHVVGTLTSGSSFHVYYNHKSQYDGGTEVCNLDVDDTSSYGPETITLHATNSKPYYYYIYRYAGSGTVASSGAQIKVSQGEREIATFNVPTNLGSGDYWNVFAIVDGQLVVRNTMTSSAETSYANTNVAVFSLRPANQDVHPEYDDRYPVKEDTVDSTNDIPVETEKDIPVEGEDEVALQSETKTVYLSLGEVDRNYTWYVETSERVYPVKVETDEIYSVELPADTETIFLYGDGDDDTTISSVEISLADIQDNNCIVALSSENEDEFEVMWAYYDLETQKVTVTAADELTISEDSSEETVSDEVTDVSQETTETEETDITEGTETEEGNVDDEAGSLNNTDTES